MADMLYYRWFDFREVQLTGALTTIEVVDLPSALRVHLKQEVPEAKRAVIVGEDGEVVAWFDLDVLHCGRPGEAAEEVDLRELFVKNVVEGRWPKARLYPALFHGGRVALVHRAEESARAAIH